jgi:hypothetical protein
MHQGLMKGQQRRGTYSDGDLSEATRAEEECSESTQQSVATRQVRRSMASTAEDNELLLEQEILRDDRSYSTGTTRLRS